jgi:beta-galactosidase
MMSVQPPYLGAAYYPEDWPLEQIDEDVKLMLDAGMNVMRIGEFAWRLMEPEENRFDFGWMHLVVDKLGIAGIATILGTPTATPPIWLVDSHPEVLAMEDVGDGVRAQHGGRRHVCPNNTVYRQYCERIVTRMADEFANDPNVIGWQIDNEVYPHPSRRGCRCPVCVSMHHEWLRKRYLTIDNLNSVWGLNIFSLAFHSFDQIPYPRIDTWHHPSLLTTWMEFQSDSYIDFIHAQAEVLHRKVTQPIGTDMMPTNGISHHDMVSKLDVAQFNHYNTPQNLWETAFWMDYLRPLKQRPFWNTETATCWNGSTAANGYREPGFCRANSWIPIALGGEANMYWLWRAHWSGHELMHGSVVSSSGRPLHIIDEVREVAAGFRAAQDFINGTKPTSSGVAIHFSELAWWMFEFQPMVNGFNYGRKLIEAFYRPLHEAHIRVDVIDPAVALDDYKIICSPFLPALDESGLREHLKKWIEGGGTWIAGPLTDVRTVDATKFTHAPFGSLEEWAGVYCPYELPADPREFSFRWTDGRDAIGSIWYSAFELRGAECLASYTDGPMEGMAAITRHRMGKGQVILLGTMPPLADIKQLLWDAGVSPYPGTTTNLLTVPRSGTAGQGIIAIELENKPAMLTLDHPMTDLLTGQTYNDIVDLAPYSVVVLKD